MSFDELDLFNKSDNDGSGDPGPLVRSIFHLCLENLMVVLVNVLVVSVA